MGSFDNFQTHFSLIVYIYIYISDECWFRNMSMLIYNIFSEQGLLEKDLEIKSIIMHSVSTKATILYKTIYL